MSHPTKIVSLFPGQGSQKVGMGSQLHHSSDIARELFAVADKALGFSLSKLCFEGPEEKLTATDIAQPAILTVSTICFQIGSSIFKNSIQVLGGAGHSLGEYSALVAAGALKFEDAVQLVHKRGRYMQEAVPRGEGKMVAVLGKEVVELEEALEKVSSGVAAIANVNAPGQIVVAGSVAAVDEFLSILGSAKSVPLSVSAPFHCALMKPAEESLKLDLQKTTFSPCSFPIYANFSATAVRKPDEVREHLIRQVCGRVRWVESIQGMIGDLHPEAFVEFGSGNVLTGLLKRIAPSEKRVNIASSEDATTFMAG